MACLACVGACSEAFYKVFDPDKACLQIVEKKAVRPIACPQCGKCAEACPEGAITQNPKGVYMINKKKCTGCGACAKACPFGLIVKTEGNPASNLRESLSDGCTGSCGRIMIRTLRYRQDLV